LEDEMKKIILDCDTGLDDAVAIINAVADRDIELMGITTVAGNVNLEYTTRNTLDILYSISREDIGVYKGEEKPLKRDLHTAEEFHGERGIGDLVLENSPAASKNIHAAEYMAKTISENPGEIIIAAVGPLTNVATLLTKYPEMKKNIKGITVMGGSLCGGNVTPFAEFNIYADPEAAEIVFSSGLAVTMVGLDATMKAKFRKNDLDFLRKENTRWSAMTVKIFDSMFRTRESHRKDFVVFHDSIALIASVKNELFTFESHPIMISTDCATRGETKVHEKGKQINVAVGFDSEGFKRYMKEIFGNGEG
jgi:inosine-uridine nucleoside N-ribohydrolase